MLAQKSWRKWALLVICVALLIPATINSSQKHKKKKGKQDLP
ncbi:MAG: hypothetical protein QOF72_129, partial [Blastocatellia bacterium]|nr:hypothetical protein [Blastocatellia bacterium]